MSLVAVQSFLIKILDDLPMPYGFPNADAYVTPPDPRTKAKVPAIYIWPSDGDESRNPELGGTIPRNTGFGTPSGLKGTMHKMDIYLTWFSSNSGRQADPVFPAMVDAVMMALRTSQPNPVSVTDPNSGVISTIYNVGEKMNYHTGIESTSDERWLRYDALIVCDIWEVFNA